MATRPKTETPELPILQCEDQGAWHDWLESNHSTAEGTWLKFAKKGSPMRTVTYAEAVEEALCYGWIDGQARGLDEHFYLQRFTPRRRKSVWSQINREKATRLIAEGRMRPSGHAQVEAAKADGRWERAYAPQSQTAVPEDFEAALASNPRAQEFFSTLRGQRRYAFLYRLHHTPPAKRAERIGHYVKLLEEGKTLHA